MPITSERVWYWVTFFTNGAWSIAIQQMDKIWKYADSIKNPLFEAYWSFLKIVLRTLLTNRSSFTIGTADEEAIRRGDEYIDKLLEEIVQNRVGEYDPYKIEDSVIGFSKKIFVNISGEAKLHNGYIKGLSTLHRPNHCSLQEQQDRLRIKAELGAGELEFRYSGSVKFMNFGPTVSVVGTLAYVEVHMEFAVNSRTGKNGRLEKFMFDDMRGMKVGITGLGPLNWALNPIVNGVTRLFKNFVRNFLESKVEKHIAERIPNFQFPVAGGNTEPATEEDESTSNEINELTETSSLPDSEETNPPDTKTPTPREPEETNPPDAETPPEEPEETNPPDAETPPPEEPEETNPPDEETPTPEEPEQTNPPDTEAPGEDNYPPKKEHSENPAESHSIIQNLEEIKVAQTKSSPEGSEKSESHLGSFGSEKSDSKPGSPSQGSEKSDSKSGSPPQGSEKSDSKSGSPSQGSEKSDSKPGSPTQGSVESESEGTETSSEGTGTSSEEELYPII